MDQTLDAVDAVLAEIDGPRGGRSEVKGSDLASPSSKQLQAECGAHKPQPTRHHKSVAFYAFIFA